MIATTIEQSKHLLELGLDPNTADMYYTGHRSIFNPKEIEYTQEPRVRAKFVSFDRLEVFFPAWSLSALLEVIPKGELVDLFVSKGGYWFCSGVHFDTPTYNSSVDATYVEVKWLLEQGLIKKGEQL